MKQIYFKAIYHKLIIILEGFLPSKLYNLAFKYPEIASKLFNFDIFLHR